MPQPPGVDLVISATGFEGAARELVHGLKYGRRLAVARLAARTIAEAAAESGMLEGGVLVPVPASELRRRWRGFDPAEEIALALARLTGLELSRCLRRRHGPRQVGRPGAERVGSPPRISMRRRDDAPPVALLVDDVWTTGATLAACAAALRAGGARRVVALTFAHVP